MNIIIVQKLLSCTQFTRLLCFRRFQHFFVSRSSKAATHVSIEAAAEQQQSNSRATAEQHFFVSKSSRAATHVSRELCVSRELFFLLWLYPL